MIDTAGVDYNHPDLKGPDWPDGNMWTNFPELNGTVGADDDGNGYVDDIHGYAFGFSGTIDPHPEPDGDEHGTHVAGTIGAVGNNGIGVVGVNWRCKIVALRIRGGDGCLDGSLASRAVEAVQYIKDNEIKVSNSSWKFRGGYCQSVYDAIKSTQNMPGGGHIFVTAAGNDDRDTDRVPMYPASYDLDNIISVAATDNDDNLADFPGTLASNFGKKTVDLGAPGDNIYSTWWDPDDDNHNYDYNYGTSMAAPHVAGVVALVWSRYPQMTWEQVRDKIFMTVRTIPALDGKTVTGGVVNAHKALDCNGNDLSDVCDTSCTSAGCSPPTCGGSLDCNTNRMPDECEPDCDGDGTPDSCESDPVEQDCDGDGTCNGVEMAPPQCVPGNPTCADCNNNSIPDGCDIDDCPQGDLSCGDCNGNGIPDGCESDCQLNGVPDDCDINAGDPDGDGSISGDCNDNDVPDECDIANGCAPGYVCTDTTPGDGVPDGCTYPSAALAPHNVRKNRYISFEPTVNDNSGATVAFGVTLHSMMRCNGDHSRTCRVDGDCPKVCDNDKTIQCFDASVCGGGNCVETFPCEEHPHVGTFLGWVGEPFQVSDGCSPLACGAEDWIALVEPVAKYRLWTETTVHVGDCEIVPVATYELRTWRNQAETPESELFGTILKPDVRHYGDVAGPVDPGTGDYAPPDGFVNVIDIQAQLHTMNNHPYGSPYLHQTWADLYGGGRKECSISGILCSEHEDCEPSGGTCIVPQAPGSPPDYIINISEVQRTKFGFIGQTYAENPGYEDPGDCASKIGRPPSGDPTVFTIVADTEFIDPGYPVNVDVFIGPTGDLGAYEVALEVTGGTSGELRLKSITIDEERPDYVFAGQSDITSVLDKRGARAGGSLAGEGVEVVATGYLATFTYQPSGGANGVFNIAVKPGYDVAILNDRKGVLLPAQPGATEVIGVGIDCFDDTDCADIVCQTGTCTNNECVYTNIAQGTPCDDGQFCTASDECDGNGICVGTGTACPVKFPQCCEFNNTCICLTCICLPE